MIYDVLVIANPIGEMVGKLAREKILPKTRWLLQ